MIFCNYGKSARITFTTPPEERERLVGEALDHEKHEMARNQDLTGFHNFRHLRLNLLLGGCFEQQISGKNLSGLVISGIAAQALLWTIPLPWIVCFVLCSLFYWAYPRDSARLRAMMAQRAEELET